VKALKAKHGPGVDARTWEFVADAQVRVDLLLGEGKLAEAVALWQEMEQRTARSHETVRRKAEATRDVVLEDAARRLDEIEAQGAAGRAEAARLAKLLESTPLAERAAALARRND
jgi:hypothetical protein